MEGKQAEQ